MTQTSHDPDPGSTLVLAVKSNVDDVYAKLRDAILSGDLHAGARLSQVQLAKKFNMSRGPLREALRLLERDGLVVTEHNRMVHVAPVSYADLDELYSIRIVNESFAVAGSVQILTGEQVERAKLSLDGMDDAARAADWTRLREQHWKFHYTLFEPAGRRTVQMLSELFDHATRYRRLYHESDILESTAVAAAEHRAIWRACADGHADEAQTLVARHLGRTVLTLFANLAPERDPVLVRQALRFAIRSEDERRQPPERQRRQSA
jgi:DNA-binding GntR family transcriptional regulator